MSDTPQTDAWGREYEFTSQTGSGTGYADAFHDCLAFARRLEREISARDGRIAELEKAIASSCDEQRNEYSPCQRAIDSEQRMREYATYTPLPCPEVPDNP